MYRIRFQSVKFGLISFFVLAFQSTLAHSLALGTIKPDFVLLMVIFFALYKGQKQGMFYGMLVGIVVDALSGGVIGINSFSLGFIGYICGLLKERVYINHFLTKFLVGLAASLVYLIVYFVLGKQFFSLPGFFANFDIVFGTMVYTSICNIFFADVLDRLVIVRSTSLL
ncbi:MAG: rod shape-determining protein MreD [Candidatus Omnitrophica bacterium]|nr:rod shape-determining protein MreD [Candidatus Omnitrophota bacterium]